jgi:hypothetical protein
MPAVDGIRDRVSLNGTGQSRLKDDLARRGVVDVQVAIPIARHDQPAACREGCRYQEKNEPPESAGTHLQRYG